MFFSASDDGMLSVFDLLLGLDEDKSFEVERHFFFSFDDKSE